MILAIINSETADKTDVKITFIISMIYLRGLFYPKGIMLLCMALKFIMVFRINLWWIIVKKMDKKCGLKK